MQLYASFLESIAAGREWPQPTAGVEPEPLVEAVAVEQDYIRAWSTEETGDAGYVDNHIDRLEKTLALTPPGIQSSPMRARVRHAML